MQEEVKVGKKLKPVQRGFASLRHGYNVKTRGIILLLGVFIRSFLIDDGSRIAEDCKTSLKTLVELVHRIYGCKDTASDFSQIELNKFDQSFLHVLEVPTTEIQELLADELSSLCREDNPNNLQSEALGTLGLFSGIALSASFGAIALALFTQGSYSS